MGFSRQEYWSGLPFPSSGDLPNSGIEHGSPAFQADALTSEPPGKPKVTFNFSSFRILLETASSVNYVYFLIFIYCAVLHMLVFLSFFFGCMWGIWDLVP